MNLSKLNQLLNDLEDYPDSRMEIIEDIRRLLHNDKKSGGTDSVNGALFQRSRVYYRRSKSANRRARNTPNKIERDRLLSLARKYLKISQDYFNAALSYGKSDLD